MDLKIEVKLIAQQPDIELVMYGDEWEFIQMIVLDRVDWKIITITDLLTNELQLTIINNLIVE